MEIHSGVVHRYERTMQAGVLEDGEFKDEVFEEIIAEILASIYPFILVHPLDFSWSKIYQIRQIRQIRQFMAYPSRRHHD